MYRSIIACLVVSLTLLVSCSTETEEEKIKSSVMSFIEDVYVTSPAFAEFPVVIQSHDSKYGSPVHAYEKYKSCLDAMVTAGLLVVDTKSKTIKAPDLSNPFKELYVQVKVTEKTYTLTEAGKESYGRDIHSRDNGFRWGKKYISSIENIEKPQQVMGRLVSEVHCFYTVTEIAPWFNQIPLEFFQNSRDDISATKAPVKENISLVKTDKGWVDSKKLRGGQ